MLSHTFASIVSAVANSGGGGVEYIGSSDTAHGVGGSIVTVTLPALEAGDLIFVAFHGGDTSTAVDTQTYLSLTTTGYTSDGSTNTTASFMNAHAHWLWKIADGTETTIVSTNANETSSIKTLRAYVFRNAVLGPRATASATGTSNLAMPWPSATAGDGAMAIVGASNAGYFEPNYSITDSGDVDSDFRADNTRPSLSHRSPAGVNTGPIPAGSYTPSDWSYTITNDSWDSVIQYVQVIDPA